MQEIMNDSDVQPEAEKLRPVLDQAMSELADRDRDAVMLRFFEARPFAEIAAKFRLTEDAARRRVERALEKLRLQLARRGITSTTAALATVLAGQAGIGTPSGLAATVTGGALVGAGATTAVAAFFGAAKVQLALAGEADLARAAVEQPHAEPLFHLRQALGDRGRRDVEFARGGRQTRLLREQHEESHFGCGFGFHFG